MKLDCQKTDYKLRFQLSELTLFSVRIQVCARQLTLRETMRLSTQAEPPEITIPEGSSAVMLRGLPANMIVKFSEQTSTTLCYVFSRSPRFYIELEGSFDDHIQRNCSSKSRSTLRRKIKKFREKCGGEIDWKIYRSPDEIAEFHTQALAVSANTYQEKLFQGGIAGDDQFKKQMLEDAAKDNARAYLLFDQGKPIAYLYLRSDEDVLTYDYLGYLPEYGKWSAGTVLQWLALESLFQENRYQLFDFTTGYGDHKRQFASNQVEEANAFFFRPTLKNRLLVAGHRAMSSFSAWVGDIVDRLGLRQKIKHLIRFGFKQS
ncbi:GNAT family N-acetyltransferase [Allochromatium palmeri]|uniref:GNAT family N-acetyltransferase n=1 Tax=Allochromatium palmeri TaxID=231048 RepID=A0A6N8EAA1_9GAMM|nr:GNAT family N-acetyltransferase [Allochromatium palmeri]MTW21202.1 GNAT family N-acetyltransferase [Allochromatium palmeri]